jgi:hypothetical protein
MCHTVPSRCGLVPQTTACWSSRGVGAVYSSVVVLLLLSAQYYSCVPSLCQSSFCVWGASCCLLAHCAVELPQLGIACSECCLSLQHLHAKRVVSLQPFSTAPCSKHSATPVTSYTQRCCSQCLASGCSEGMKGVQNDVGH